MSATYTNFAAEQSTKDKHTVNTPATAPIKGRESEMAPNNNGGFSFTLDKWGVLDRFLLIGTESAGYTVSSKDLTAKAFNNVIACAKEDGPRLIKRVLEISVNGRAPKNDPAVVALAIAASVGDANTAALAFAQLPAVARTGTWLFQFVSILESMKPTGTWNAAAKRGVANWYNSKSIDKLAVQLLKYQQRDGWSHRDVLRLAHIKPTEQTNALFRYVVKGADSIMQGEIMPQLVIDFERLKRATSKQEVLNVINSNSAVTWEMVPTQWHSDADVLTALLPNMGLTAMIRKLGVLTTHGVIGGEVSEGQKIVESKINDAEALKRARVHPLTLLQAQRQYAAGKGERSDKTWSPAQRVVDALNSAFYAAFDNVEDTGASVLIGVDVSPSMFGAKCNGSANITAAEVAGVLALVTAKTQKNSFIGGFARTFVPLKISPNMTLDTVMAHLREFYNNWGSTNISATHDYAITNKMDVDVFQIITDNDVNSGRQPTVSLKDYRSRAGKPNAAQIVLATSTDRFTVADPKDPRQLDVAGFDTAVPTIMSEFIKASR
jgi:60 kDa SS-A/Ro ribonucleoprotein